MIDFQSCIMYFNNNDMKKETLLKYIFLSQLNNYFFLPTMARGQGTTSYPTGVQNKEAMVEVAVKEKEVLVSVKVAQ